MHFSTFANHLHQLEGISARLAITAELSKLFHDLEPSEIKPASYLLQGQLRPAYASLEFQLSTKMVIRALAGIEAQKHELSNASTLFGEPDIQTAESFILKRHQSLGDLGDVAAEVVSAQKKDLVLAEVYEQLVAIAETAGEGSQERKLASLTELLSQVSPTSAKYIIRIILGKLRLGFSTMTMIDALSWTIHGSKADSAALEAAYNKQADIGELAQMYLSASDEKERQRVLRSEYSVKVGVPVLPALCQRLNNAAEVIEKMGEVMVEPKYDGVRVQVHFDRRAGKDSGGQVHSYTRSLEENSHQFPELAQLADTLQCQSCILDGEAIGYDKATGKLLPFQETITRKRKHEVAEQAASIPLKFFFFDVLFLDGKSLIEETLRDRKEALNKLFKDNEHFVHTPVVTTQDPKEVRDLHNQYLAENLEGVVIKQVDSDYGSGRKGWQWVKMKEAEGTRGKLNDTLDCVVMGYYFGEGKRNAFGIGAFLVGVIDSKTQQLLTIAKIGTGLSDDQFREMKTRADALKTTHQPPTYQVAKNLVPDVWVEPGIVVEIAADELTKSPSHSAGLALRFPRLVKFRDDKKHAMRMCLHLI